MTKILLPLTMLAVFAMPAGAGAKMLCKGTDAKTNCNKPYIIHKLGSHSRPRSPGSVQSSVQIGTPKRGRDANTSDPGHTPGPTSPILKRPIVKPKPAIGDLGGVTAQQ